MGKKDHSKMEAAEQEGVLSAVPIPAAADAAESEGGAENVSPLNLASSLKDRFTLTRSQSSGMLNKLKNCVGVTSIQGRRPEMEDAHKIVPPPSPSPSSTKLSFFGVFDGHGGRRAADFAEARLYELLLEHDDIASDPEAALRVARTCK